MIRDSKYFKEWVKSIEKYARLVGLADESIRLVAYQASKGPVSDFLKRYMDAHQDHGWDRIKGELRIRFGEIINRQHALLLLRKVKQKVGESVQVYSERLIELAEDANDGNNMEATLIGYFIDGLLHDYLKMKVMRDNPQTLNAAIEVATAEQNIRKRFNLRTGHDFGPSDNKLDRTNIRADRNEQPMEVDHYRRPMKCYECKRTGHLARDCVHRTRQRPRQVNATDVNRQGIQCWNCRERGHIARECQKPRKQILNTGPLRM